MARRLEKTFADYVVIALTPALIMLLVGSLVFFLLEIGYQGQFEQRLRWILFWFVFGSVLISRIGIEQGTSYARMYGLVLGGATGLVVVRYVDNTPVALGLLAVVWWCTAKLTWDCTLIDDSVDASGEGLLSAAGIENGNAESAAADSTSDEADPDAQASNSDGKDGRKGEGPHAPGLWVVYFSLAALPLFGLGQLMIPAEDSDGRAYAFLLLLTYVAAGLGLLLATSFLGLRRYLRQRRLKMPTAMAFSWMVLGAVLIVAILGVAILLPRPDATYSLSAIADRIGSQQREASERAMLRDDPGTGQGRRIGNRSERGEGQQQRPGNGEGDLNQPGGQGQKSAQGGQSGQQSGEGEQTQEGRQGGDPQSEGNQETVEGSSEESEQSQRSRRSTGQSSEQREQAGNERSEDSGEQSQSESASNSPARSPTEFLASLAPMLKWIIYGLFALAALYFLVRHWKEILQGIRQFWEMILSLFGFSLPKPGEERQEERVSPLEALRPPPFAAFSNPFSSGRADEQAPSALVVYTFQALESWAYEQGCRRLPDQTPAEFAAQLALDHQRVRNPLRDLAQAYGAFAYASRSPSRDEAKALEPLWRYMTQYQHRAENAATAAEASG